MSASEWIGLFSMVVAVFALIVAAFALYVANLRRGILDVVSEEAAKLSWLDLDASGTPGAGVASSPVTSLDGLARPTRFWLPVVLANVGARPVVVEHLGGDLGFMPSDHLRPWSSLAVTFHDAFNGTAFVSTPFVIDPSGVFALWARIRLDEKHLLVDSADGYARSLAGLTAFRLRLDARYYGVRGRWITGRARTDTQMASGEVTASLDVLRLEVATAWANLQTDEARRLGLIVHPLVASMPRTPPPVKGPQTSA